METNLKTQVEFKYGCWGFVVYTESGTVVADSWLGGGFPMATDPNSAWQRQQVEGFAEIALTDAELLFRWLDKMEERNEIKTTDT